MISRFCHGHVINALSKQFYRAYIIQLHSIILGEFDN